MVIVGGMGNIWGVAAGAFIVFLIQAVLLKQLSSIAELLNVPPINIGPVHFNLATFDFTEYQYLLFGIALVIMMLKRPEGLFPSRERRAELHAADDLGPDDPALLGALGDAPGSDDIGSGSEG
jgi:branched-chain amino acid transport system permease protein